MDNTTKSVTRMPAWAKMLITMVIIVGAGALMISQLPRGVFPTDLSRIGQGTPALVVARDISYLEGAEVMDLLNGIRHEYGDRVEFLAAHLGHPDGQAFAHRHGMRDGSVVVLAGDGSRVAVLHQPRSADVIHQALEQAATR